MPRKSGKTALAINKLLIEAFRKPGKTFWYVAPTYRQAKEIVWKDPEMLQRFLPEELVEKKNELDLTVYLKNGSVLSVKGADEPDALRGPNPAMVVLDEFALMKPEVWTEIIQPIALNNPEMIVWFVFTPKVQGPHAHKLFLDHQLNKKGWFTLRIPMSKLGLLSEEELRDAKESMTEHGFRQEFECEFLSDEGAVFRFVDRIVDKSLDPNSPPNPYRQYKFGIDLGRHSDYTATIALDRSTWYATYVDRYRGADYSLHETRIEAVMRRYSGYTSPSEAHCDATGVGDPIVTALQQRGLDVKPFVFTTKTKRELIENLVVLIEQQKIRIPKHDQLIRELKNYAYDVSPKGHVTYSAPSGEHDDLVTALALACWQLGEKVYESNEQHELKELLGEASKEGDPYAMIPEDN